MLEKLPPREELEDEDFKRVTFYFAGAKLSIDVRQSMRDRIRRLADKWTVGDLDSNILHLDHQYIFNDGSDYYVDWRKVVFLEIG